MFRRDSWRLWKSASRKPALANRLLAVSITAALLFWIGLGWEQSGRQAPAAEGPIHTSGSEKKIAGKFFSIHDNELNMSVADDEHFTHKVLSPKVKVTLNGQPARLEDLREGYSVVVTTTKEDAAVAGRIDATVSKSGKIVSVDGTTIKLTPDGRSMQEYQVGGGTDIKLNGKTSPLHSLKTDDLATLILNPAAPSDVESIDAHRANLLHEFWENFRKNLFKPLLLFFYMGFSVPFLKIAFEFPHVIYQGLTIYLLVAIGWHGGEELAALSGKEMVNAVGFMVVGFITNFFIGIASYLVLRGFIPRMRRVDAATVSAYYGSDSAGTFVTCVGVLATAKIASAAYMPVMLAIMEIPGCLVGLYLVSKLRNTGMDALGNMPDEPGFNPQARAALSDMDGAHGHHPRTAEEKAVDLESKLSHENADDIEPAPRGHSSIFNTELLREVFLNPGLFLLFGGIIIGFVSRLQGEATTKSYDPVFITLFYGLLCLFLLEMGMTASRRLQDLKTAGWRFIVFGLVAPNVFATTGIIVAHFYSMAIGEPFELGTYVLFSVLCGAASYIAVPAIQRLAIPEASPTLPLAASLGLTFSYNVTVGIPVYIMIATMIMKMFPHAV